MEDLGDYYLGQRRDEILGKWSEEESSRKKRLLQKNCSSKVDGGKSALDEDFVKIEMERIQEEVVQFQKDCDRFNGPHFNKLYRALITQSINLQCTLDRLDLSQKEKLRQERKSLINEIDRFIKEVKSKVHPGGKACPECEVTVL